MRGGEEIQNEDLILTLPTWTMTIFGWTYDHSLGSRLPSLINVTLRLVTYKSDLLNLDVNFITCSQVNIIKQLKTVARVMTEVSDTKHHRSTIARSSRAAVKTWMNEPAIQSLRMRLICMHNSFMYS